MENEPSNDPQTDLHTTDKVRREYWLGVCIGLIGSVFVLIVSWGIMRYRAQVLERAQNAESEDASLERSGHRAWNVARPAEPDREIQRMTLSWSMDDGSTVFTRLPFSSMHMTFDGNITTPILAFRLEDAWQDACISPDRELPSPSMEVCVPMRLFQLDEPDIPSAVELLLQEEGLIQQ